MFSKFEMVLGGVFIMLMAVGLYSIQVRTTLDQATQPAAAITGAGVEVVSQEPQVEVDSTDVINNQTMKIDDVKVGTGESAKEGDTVAVHYVGRLQDGTEFDNSNKRGEPIVFKIGAGMVIPGWEEGIQGMQVGGERVLVIPPEMAYGERGIGPIPPNATLTFTVELVEIQ